MSRIGIEMLSAMGLSPLELVALSADLGCAHISTGLTQMPAQFNPLGRPDWSLRDDPALRRDMKAMLADRGISVSLGEGFAVRPGVAMRDRGADMDIMAELGARGLGAVSMEPDAARAMDEFAALAEMAGERGLLATIEFAPIQSIATLAGAVEVVRHVSRPNFGLVVDAMHFFRTGGRVADLEALSPGTILYAQLCDAPAGDPGPDYMTEAMFGRRALGEGGFPLAAFAAALPKDIPVGLEIPNLTEARSGVTDRDRLARSVAAARILLNEGV